MDRTFIYVEGEVCCVSIDLGEFIRYVNPRRMAYIVHRSKVQCLLKEGTPYYRLWRGAVPDSSFLPEDVEAFNYLKRLY